MQIPTLTQQLTETPDILLSILNAFDQQTFNQTTNASSWTAGQVADHLVKACDLSGLLEGNVRPADRDPDALSAGIAAMFLDFTHKMESPEFILPDAGPFDPRQSARALGSIWQTLQQKSRELDLSMICLDFELPETGALTRQEWLSFVIVHTQRHIHQLRKIAAELNIPLPSAA